MTEDRPHSPRLPQRIAALTELAGNLWWSWDRNARALFRAVDPGLWQIARHDPIALLARVDPRRLEACAAEGEFVRRYDDVVAAFRSLQSNEGTWYAAHGAGPGVIAYFSAEFALHTSVPIYSGGLGVLAGDHCKGASDLGVPLVAVGLLYTKGYFEQTIRADGWQLDADAPFDARRTPLAPVLAGDGAPLTVAVPMEERTVHVGAWRVMVGRVPLYLLDTDVPDNEPADRALCQKLYGGGADLRLRQEWVLGVGGVRLLRAVGVTPAVWHANEGHTVFMLLERLREACAAGAPLSDAVSQIRAASVFTTHTPVPAGHDVFPAAAVERCAGSGWHTAGVDQAAVLGLGEYPAGQANFHVTAAAIRLADRVNGVAQKHGAVSREMWQPLWPGRPADAVPIGHVTNGVHLETWLALPLAELFDGHLGSGWQGRLDDPEVWDRVLTLDDGALWRTHVAIKQSLINYMREDARRRLAHQWTDGAQLTAAGTLLEPRALTIGFARRFATYKRADLVFHDPERLRRLLTDPRRPVQMIFAGKAHPADDGAKQVLQRVYQAAQDRTFEGRIAFLEDYELHLAHRLVQGVDVWLNLPQVPLEACGTSGMKAGLNCVPQLSTADGWWAEGYNGSNGWVIDPAPAGHDANAWDAERFYGLLEHEVVPAFYARDDRDVPPQWLHHMKAALHVAGSRFTARRMVQAYVRSYYGREP